jgi:hypothetical protein
VVEVASLKVVLNDGHQFDVHCLEASAASSANRTLVAGTCRSSLVGLVTFALIALIEQRTESVAKAETLLAELRPVMDASRRHK